MKRFTFLTMTLVVLTLFCLILPQRAYAYIDPGSGSYFFQLIIATLIGTLYAAKRLRNKIKIFFKNLFFKAKKHEKSED